MSDQYEKTQLSQQADIINHIKLHCKLRTQGMDSFTKKMICIHIDLLFKKAKLLKWILCFAAISNSDHRSTI